MAQKALDKINTDEKIQAAAAAGAAAGYQKALTDRGDETISDENKALAKEALEKLDHQDG